MIEKYNGYTIEIEYDQSASDPTGDGNFTIHEKAEFHDDSYDYPLTNEAIKLIESGELWPFQHYTHGVQSSYKLSESNIVNDGWIKLSPEYVLGVSKTDRKQYAKQDLAVYEQWANGEVYFVQVRDPYGDLVADDGEGMGDIIGYEDALNFGKQVVDSHGINYATKAKNARELHR